MKTMRWSFVFSLFLVLVCGSWLNAQQTEKKQKLPFVHPLFSDHMVLQRDKPVNVWGWASPGSIVSVEIADDSISAKSNGTGKWTASIGPMSAGGPHKMKVSGPETVEFSDVMVGDVWICSGQSNMEWSVRNSNNPEKEIADANHPQLRLFKVPRKISMTPQKTVDASWQVCSPETVPNFTAVGYFFGRDLQKEISVPVGLVQTAWGGTLAEAWTSAGALKTMGDFDQALEKFAALRDDPELQKSQIPKAINRWVNNNDPAPKAKEWRTGDFDDQAWPTMDLPGHWEQAVPEMKEYDGTVWFRREFELPGDWASEKATLHLAAVDDADVTWVNGKKVGTTNGYGKRRKYPVGDQLRPGKNTVTVLAYDGGSGGGIHGSPDSLAVQLESGKSISLAGPWHYRKSKTVKDIRRFPQQGFGSNPNMVTVLHNGMLAPLTGYGIKGATWYQGESNAGRAEQYGRLLPTMIGDWRSQFAQGDFPFLVVQLANFRKEQERPSEPGWADLRESQRMTAANDPNVGLAVITDIGAANDIHPRNKQDVGKRLVLQALRIAYGKDQEELVAAGPTASGFSVAGNEVHISFEEVGGGLQAKGDAGGLKGFAIAAADGEFVWADAKIDGEKVILSSSEISSPARVRYNWADNPVGNLFNSEGLPAGPFKWTQE